MKMTTTTSCLSLTTVESTASESLISATTLASKSNSKPSESISTPEWVSYSSTFDVNERFTEWRNGKHFIKKIKQDVEKWESEFLEFSIDINDGKHDEL